MFRMYSDPARADVAPEIEQRLTSACHNALVHFTREVPRDSRESWTPLVALVVRELLALDDDKVTCSVDCSVMMCSFKSMPQCIMRLSRSFFFLGLMQPWESWYFI